MIFPLTTTSQSVDILIVDDSGLVVTGLLAVTFPTMVYSLAGANADVAFPALSDLATISTAYASGGVKERGNGVYRVDVPDGIFTTAGKVTIRGEASGKHALVPPIEVAVTVATLTNLPAAAALEATLTTMKGATFSGATDSLEAISTQLAAIQAKTGSLTFTVAGKVDANLHYVNGIQVSGSGTSSDPWGPA